MSRVKKKPRPDIQFLRDYAITSARDDEFRHASVAKTLERIIEQASTPMTIGMFGSWGAGKSGISSMLMASLRKKKKIACIEFDVWKYEDEASLRRQFIHSLLRQLTEQGLAGKANLNERLEGSVSEEVTEPAIDRAALTRLVLLLLVIIAAALSGHALVVTGVSLAAIISVVGLNTIVKSGLEIIKNKKKTITHNQLTDADQFEKEFHDIIDTCEADKLLVVIDNLDRATEENAIRILSTIKSFLEYDKCLYLIPCDEAAMKKHLARVFGESDKGANVKNADEFLRKFFNTHLRIPQFIDADLQDYTEKQLRLTNFHHYARIQDLATVITAAYRENPRQIKQFINIFLSHFLLAQEREREGHLSRGDITNNPEFLAKILVIQQRWPAAYVLIRTGSSLEDAADEADYRNFLEASSLADEPANLKAFLYFKQSKRASDLPPGLADLLETATHDAKFDDVQHFIHQIQDVKDHTMQLNRFFLELLENAAGLGRRQQLVNILNSLAHVWASKTFKLQDNLMRHAARVIKNKLTARDLFAVADDFVTELLAEIGSKSTKDIIADKYMDAIKLLGDVQHGIPKDDVGGVSRCINFIEANAGLYDTPAKRQKLSLSLERSSQFLSLSQINQSKNVIALCDASFILHIINGISLNDMPRRHKSRVTSKYRIKSEIIKFAYTANRERYLTTNDGLLIKDSYLQASAPLIAEVLSKAASPYHWSVLRVFAEVFSEYRGYIRDEETTASLIQQLLKAGHELEEGEHTADILQVLLLLQGHVNQEQNAKIEQFVREFAAKKASNTYLLLSHPSLDSDRMFELIYPALLDTVFKEAAFVSVIWNYGNEAKQLNLIRKLLTEGAGYDGGLRLVEQHLEAGDLPNKAEVSSLLLQGARQEHPKNRGYYYKLLLRLPLPGREQKIEFANQLANLAMHDEREFQVRAHKWIQESGALLSKGLRRTICFKIIGWLEKQGTLNRQYLNAINICLDDLNTLVRSDRQRLYTVIFDQWLVEEEDSQEVRRAATDLRIKTVPLAELKGYLARVEEWSNYYPTASELLFLKKHWEATAKR